MLKAEKTLLEAVEKLRTFTSNEAKIERNQILFDLHNLQKNITSLQNHMASLFGISRQRSSQIVLRILEQKKKKGEQTNG